MCIFVAQQVKRNTMEKQYECSLCPHIGVAADFKKCSIANDKRLPVCKKCEAKYQKQYKQSKRGHLTKIYHNQVLRSKRRGHNPPMYTREEFIEEFINNNDFNRLYLKWVSSGFETGKSPSFDRMDNYKGYSFDNLNKWMTWNENNAKALIDKMNGRCDGGKKRKAVALIDYNGSVVKRFISASAASRYSGVQTGNISHCCRGDRDMAGGYKWKHI